MGSELVPWALGSPQAEPPFPIGQLAHTLVICPYSVRTVGSTNHQVFMGLEEAQSLANGQGGKKRGHLVVLKDPRRCC